MKTITSIDDFKKIFEEGEDKTPDTKLYRGSAYQWGIDHDWYYFCQMLNAGDFNAEEFSLEDDWLDVHRWGDGGYRVVWVSPKQRSTFTYCEGDLTLVTCDTDEAFIEELRDAEKFYSESKGVENKNQVSKAFIKAKEKYAGHH